MGVVFGRFRAVAAATAVSLLALGACTPTQTSTVPGARTAYQMGAAELDAAKNSTADAAARRSHLENARDSCATAANTSPGERLDALMCVGAAQAQLGQYTDAATNYDKAAKESETAHNSAQASRAYLGEGDALYALFGQSSGAAATGYVNSAIDAYNASIGLNAGRDNQYHLGLALFAGSKEGGVDQPEHTRWEMARSAYTNALNASGGSASSTQILIARARVRQVLEGDAGAQQDYRLAAQSGSPEAHVALASALLANGDYSSTTRDHVASAANWTGPERAEGLLDLSILDAQTAATYPQWDATFNTAQNAVTAGGIGVQYRNQICLTYIGRGLSAQQVQDNALDMFGSSACEIDTSAQGQLLRGMYYLRKAQYLNTQASLTNAQAQRRYLDALGAADAAFKDGARNFAAQSGQRLTLAGRSQDTLLVELRYGSYVAAGCSNSLRERMIDSDRQLAKPLFDRYQVFNCKP